MAPDLQALFRPNFLQFHSTRTDRPLSATVVEFNRVRGSLIEAEVARGWLNEAGRPETVVATTEPIDSRHLQSEHQDTQSESSAEMDFNALLLRDFPELAYGPLPDLFDVPDHTLPAASNRSLPPAVHTSQASGRTDIELPQVLLAPNEQIPKPGYRAEAYRNVLVETFRNWDRPLAEVVQALNEFYQTDISEHDAQRWIGKDSERALKLIPMMTSFFIEYGLMTSTQARSHPCFPTGRISERSVQAARLEARRVMDARADALEIRMDRQLPATASAWLPVRAFIESQPGVCTDPITGDSYDMVPRSTAPVQRPVLRSAQQVTQQEAQPRSPNSMLAPSATIDDFDWGFL
ncbi:hypothetical protein BH09PSE5_BH09PSE5_13010 [soil metagenome]